MNDQDKRAAQDADAQDDDAKPVAAQDAPLVAAPDARDDDDEDDDDSAQDAASDARDVDALKREIERLRRQAARYRRERNELRAKLADDPLAAAERRAADAERRARIVEALAERGVSPAVLRALDALKSDADPQQAAEEIAALLRVQRAATSTFPKLTTSTPATLVERIADAERRGDVREAIRLKAELALKKET